METKQCTKCGEVKPLGEFCKKGNRLRSECKVCQRAIHAKYRAENSEKVKAKKAKWDAENREREKARAAKWRAENREREKARAAKWSAENREKVKAMTAKRIAELKPAYVAECLGIPASHLTPDLLEAKREQILNVRVTRQLIQTLKEIQNGK